MLDIMLATHTALRQFPILQRKVTLALETQITNDEERHHLHIARLVVQLEHTQKIAGVRKIAGIKLICDALRIGLKQSKELWEVAATLEDQNPYTANRV